jgi:hypothetical protein
MKPSQKLTIGIYKLGKAYAINQKLFLIKRLFSLVAFQEDSYKLRHFDDTTSPLLFAGQSGDVHGENLPSPVATRGLLFLSVLATPFQCMVLRETLLFLHETAISEHPTRTFLWAMRGKMR